MTLLFPLYAAASPDPATACSDLADLTGFPVVPTEITLATWIPNGAESANGVSLPEHCQIQGIINERTGTDGLHYGIRFEVRLPTYTDWNGRFMFQGGGGSEGSLPRATGTAGTISPTLAHGWAVASQNGGHENSDLGPDPSVFWLERQAVIDHSYNAIDVTTQTAKFLVDAFYGRQPDYSYSVGCSTGGRQGMVFSQNFPDYYDGILAGDPVYASQAIHLTETWAVQAIKAITPTPIVTLPDGRLILYPAFPVPDQELFTSALLQACDELDGVLDGVVDDMRTCDATFDPATYVFSDTGQPLQCTGTKMEDCLSPEQIDAIKKIHEGPRNSAGEMIKAPAGAAVHPHPDNTILGYPYDGGFMASGQAGRKIGTPTSPPSDYRGVTRIGWEWLDPPDPSFDGLSFDWDTDVDRLLTAGPLVSSSSSLNIEKFRNRGGKIIWYHGLSDPGPPVTGTIMYYNALAKKSDGLRNASKFSRLYLIPNMGHCRGGSATDQFDMLTPLVNWVENGVAPDEIIASGQNFTSEPTTRNRPLCPHPKVARFVGGDLSDATDYQCITPPGADDDINHAIIR